MSDTTSPPIQPATDTSAEEAVANEGQEHMEESPNDPVSTRKKLEHQLSSRPDKQELVDKNILKASNVAPALQAAEAELQRSQLEDKLDHALQQRPSAQELVKEGILMPDEAPTTA